MSLLNDVDMLCKETVKAVDEVRDYAVKAMNELAAQKQAEINLLRKQRTELLDALAEYSTGKNPSGVCFVTTSYADEAIAYVKGELK